MAEKMTKTPFLHPLLLGTLLLTVCSLTPVLGEGDCFQGQTRWDSSDKWKEAGRKWGIESALPVSVASGETCDVGAKAEDSCAGAIVKAVKTGQVFMYRGCASKIVGFLEALATELQAAASGGQAGRSGTSSSLKGRDSSSSEKDKCGVVRIKGVVMLVCDFDSPMLKNGGGRRVGNDCAAKFEEFLKDTSGRDDQVKCTDGNEVGSSSPPTTGVINVILLIIAAAAASVLSSSSFWSMSFNMD